MNRFAMAFTLTSILAAGAGSAATFSEYMAGDLGSTLIDEAALGGADLNLNGGSEIFAGFQVRNLWNAGDDVSLTGIALPIWSNNTAANNNTENGTFTFTFYDLGADGVYSGSGSETLLGSAQVTFDGEGDGVFVLGATFDSAIDFTAESDGLVFRIENTDSIRLKRGPNMTGEQIRIDNGNLAGGGGQFGSFTLAGTVIPAPGTIALGSVALAGFTARRRR
ncbi:MAG: hypothetical protein AAF297_11280 [Planctomycetota bacterium]